jgi:hypothetical protein
LVFEPGRPVRILPPGARPEPKPNVDAVQLPVLADGDQRTPESHEPGAMRQRGALCVLPTGRVLVAMARHDSSAPLATALLRSGCRRVVELDRGSKHPSFVHLAETETPPLSDYETTVVYALAVPMSTTAFRWKPKGSRPSTHPTGYDVPAPGARHPAGGDD